MGVTGFKKTEAPGTILCVGYAKPPTGIAVGEVYKVMGVGLEVDPKTGEIINVSCTLVTQLAQDFIASLLVGHNMNEGWERLGGYIEKRYLAPEKKALVAAIKSACERYRDYVEGKMQGD